MADLLLIDNDARIADLVAFFLRRSGHSVRTAKTFVEARAEIGRARPDLVLSDLDLGAENGLVELPRLSAEGLLSPTLVVSGFLDRGAQIELERLPEVVGVLAKPFDLDVLVARVGEALARSPAATRCVEDEGWIELEPNAERA